MEEIRHSFNKNVLDKDISLKSDRFTFKPAWIVDSKDLSDRANLLEIAIAVGLPFPNPYTIDDANKFKEYSIKSWENGTEYSFAIFDKNDNSYIGNIGFKPNLNNVNEIENIGYWLGKDYWGKGIATEAMGMVLDFIKVKFPNVNKIKAGAFDYNIASQRVLENCGFEKVGIKKENVLLRNGKVVNSLAFVLNVEKGK